MFKMPIPHIGDYKEKKKKSHMGLYLLCGIAAVIVFYSILFSTKALIFVVGFLIKNWIYGTIGVLVLLILIRKIKKMKRKREFKKNEHRNR